MILQVLERAGQLGCQWAKHVPNDDAPSSSGSEISSGEDAGGGGRSGRRKLLLVCDVSLEAGGDTLALRRTMDEELRRTLGQCDVDVVDNVKEATYALVVLTGGLLRDESSWMDTLDLMVKFLPPSNIVYTCVGGAVVVCLVVWLF